MILGGLFRARERVPSDVEGWWKRTLFTVREHAPLLLPDRLAALGPPGWGGACFVPRRGAPSGIKITTDLDEARWAEHMHALKPPGFVRVLSELTIISVGPDGTAIDDDDANATTLYIYHREVTPKVYVPPRREVGPLRDWVDARGELLAELSNGVLDDDTRDALGATCVAPVLLRQAPEVSRGLLLLHEKELYVDDAYPGNWGRRSDGTVVVFDAQIGQW